MNDADFSRARILITHCREGIELAKANGLSPDCKVLSRSPALLLDSTIDVTPLDKDITVQDIQRHDQAVVASAQFNLGVMYGDGEGVPANNVRA